MYSYKIKSDLQKLHESETRRLNPQPKMFEELCTQENKEFDYPCSYLNNLLCRVIETLFGMSDRINRNILIMIVKDIGIMEKVKLSELDFFSDEYCREVLEEILEIVINRMESLYYFHEDNVFQNLIFNLCFRFDLDPIKYGFTCENNSWSVNLDPEL